VEDLHLSLKPQLEKESIAKYLGRVAMIYNDFKRSEDRGNLKLVPLAQRAAYLAIRCRCREEYQQELSQIDEKIAKSERKKSVIGNDYLSANQDLLEIERKDKKKIVLSLGQKAGKTAPDSKTKVPKCRYDPCTRQDCSFYHPKKEQFPKKRKSDEVSTQKAKKTFDPKGSLACAH
jgi:hypothetical protein